MDEFSWFVGLYEGEGCLSSGITRKKYKGRIIEGTKLELTIKMVDEDVISRAADFLGVKYGTVKPNPGCKPLYRVRKMGGANGQVRELLEKMRPYLSKRRNEQIDAKLAKINK